VRYGLYFAWLASLVANILNWIFNIYLNRVLNLAEFSQVSVVLNGLMLMSTVAVAIQYAITKFVSHADTEKPSGFSRFFSSAFIICSLLAFVVCFGSLVTIPWWTAYLKLTISLPIAVILCAALGGLFVAALTRGLLYGRRSYCLVGFALLFESVIKVGLILSVGFTTLPVFSSSFIAIAISLCLPYTLFLIPFLIKYPLMFSLHYDWLKKILRFAGFTFLTAVSSQMLLFTDLIFVKHYFSPELSGVYATLSLIGKMIYFFTTSIAVLITPEVAIRVAAQKHTTGILYKSICFTLFTGITITFLFAFFPQYTLKIFLDPVKVGLAYPYLMLYGLIVTLISLIVVVSAYLVFANYRYFVFGVILGLFIQLTGIYLFHETLQQIIQIMLSAALITLAAIAALVKLEIRYRKNISASPGTNISF
jgi:O-antigen/teichoic acid export membrane protein